MAAYQAADTWKEFSLMEETDFGEEDAVTNVKAVPVLIQAEGNMMTISGAAAGTPINVYDLNGRQLSNTTAAEGETRVNVGTTEKIVLVKVGEKTIKIAL